MKELCSCKCCASAASPFVTPWCELLKNQDASCSVLHLWYKLDVLRQEIRQRLAYLGNSTDYQNVPNVFDLVGAGENASADPLHFSFPIATLREEIEKITAYLGKFRRTEEAQHLLDLIAMTEDENALFITYAQESTMEVWSTLSAPFVAVQKNGWWQETATDAYSAGVHYLFDLHYVMTPNETEPLRAAILEALVNRIIYKWLLMSYPNEAKQYETNYQQALAHIAKHCNDFKARWSGLFLPLAKASMTDVFDVLAAHMPKHEKALWWREGQETAVFSDDPALPSPPVKYYAGQYVEYNGDLYMAIEDGDSDDFATKIVPSEDYRDSIHYGILWNCSSNINAVEPLDVSVFEALIARIIYKWLQYSYPVEAKRYLDEYNEYLAQIKNRARILEGAKIVNRIPSY